MSGSFCTICRRRIPKGSRCARHRLKSPSSRAWHRPGSTKLRVRVLRRARGRCEQPGCDQLAAEIHHIRPISEGGEHELANCIALCVDHHRDAHA